MKRSKPNRIMGSATVALIGEEDVAEAMCCLICRVYEGVSKEEILEKVKKHIYAVDTSVSNYSHYKERIRRALDCLIESDKPSALPKQTELKISRAKEQHDTRHKSCSPPQPSQPSVVTGLPEMEVKGVNEGLAASSDLDDSPNQSAPTGDVEVNQKHHGPPLRKRVQVNLNILRIVLNIG